jgi:hypothetical protein
MFGAKQQVPQRTKVLRSRRIVGLHNLWLKDNRHMIADSKMRSLAFPLRWLKGYMKLLIANERGAVALEATIIFKLLALSLLLPLVDLSIVGIQFLSGWQTLSSFGEYAQTYAEDPNHSPDFSNLSGWTSKLRTSWNSNKVVSALQVVCGDANPAVQCSPGNTNPPRRLVYQTTVTLNFMWLGPLFKCSNNTPCPKTLTQSEPFQ